MYLHRPCKQLVNCALNLCVRLRDFIEASHVTWMQYPVLPSSQSSTLTIGLVSSLRLATICYPAWNRRIVASTVLYEKREHRAGRVGTRTEADERGGIPRNSVVRGLAHACVDAVSGPRAADFLRVLRRNVSRPRLALSSHRLVGVA